MTLWAVLAYTFALERVQPFFQFSDIYNRFILKCKHVLPTVTTPQNHNKISLMNIDYNARITQMEAIRIGLLTYQVHLGSKNRIKYMSPLLAVSPG